MSWKHSFIRLNEEYELAKKKKKALGNLLDAGKISQSTHSLFTQEIDDSVAEIEGQRKALLGKMASKAMELEEHIRTLEILLANFEIQHVVGEVDDDTYHRETDLLCTGLETVRKELNAVQDAVNQLSNDDVVTQQEIERSQTQAAEPEAKLSEEPLQASEKEGGSEETVVETIRSSEETQNPETEAKLWGEAASLTSQATLPPLPFLAWHRPFAWDPIFRQIHVNSDGELPVGSGGNLRSGFCLLNVIAVLVEYMTKKHGVEHFIVLDHDVYFGNSASDTYCEESTVLRIFLHQHHAWFIPKPGLYGKSGKEKEGDGRKDNPRVKEVIEKKLACFGDFSASGIR
jgi:hypothetical protein